LALSGEGAKGCSTGTGDRTHLYLGRLTACGLVHHHAADLDAADLDAVDSSVWRGP
jgi:hypothetical protein